MLVNPTSTRAIYRRRFRLVLSSARSHDAITVPSQRKRTSVCLSFELARFYVQCATFDREFYFTSRLKNLSVVYTFCIKRFYSAPQCSHCKRCTSYGNSVCPSVCLSIHLLWLRRCNAKCVKTRCYQEGVGQFEPRFHGEMVVPVEYFFGFYKTRHILLSDSANCTVLRAVVLTQYQRVTDGRTDRRTDRQTELL